LLDVSIKTGRTHQIRVHLSSKKLPIVGDKTYNPSSNIAKGTPMVLTDIIRDFPRQALHSYHLSFEDIDTNQTRTFEAPIPDAITNLCNILEKHI
jgi:23S rRNA pseudouridine1911/1915/1917 synthase